MTSAALLFMIVSVSFVIALAGWCYYKVLASPADRGSGISRDRA